MGGENSKDPKKQMVLPENEIKIRAKFVAGFLEHQVDKEVTNLIKYERTLLDKYGQDKRTIEDLLFRDEFQIIMVTVNKVRAYKKLVMFFKFLENTSKRISDCKGQFEQLTEAGQSSCLNLAFTSDYLDTKEIVEFGNTIKQYFRLSPTFYSMYTASASVDPELKNYCLVVKHQRASPKELAEYYLSYMDRMGKEADPKVKEKLKNKQYEDTVLPPNPFGAPGMPGMPGAPGGPGFPGGPGMPGAPGGYNFGGPGGYSQNPPRPPAPGFGAPPGFGGGGGGYAMNTGAQPQANPFAGNAGGYNTLNSPYAMNNAGYGTPFGGAGGYGAGNPFAQPAIPQQPYGQATQPSNPFATPPSDNYAKGAPQSAYKPVAYPVPPIDEIKKASTIETGPPGQFDDIFQDHGQTPSGPAKKPAFGGDRPDPQKVQEKQQMDDFLKQLDDLKKL